MRTVRQGSVARIVPGKLSQKAAILLARLKYLSGGDVDDSLCFRVNAAVMHDYMYVCVCISLPVSLKLSWMTLSII